MENGFFLFCVCLKHWNRNWVYSTTLIDHLLTWYLHLNAAGSINISNILTGKCLAKINASNGNPKVNDDSSSSSSSSSSAGSSRKVCNSSQMRNTVAEALEDITALFYDEERNEIYTGNKNGLVHVWSNWRPHFFKKIVFLLFFFSFLKFALTLIKLMIWWWRWKAAHMMSSNAGNLMVE